MVTEAQGRREVAETHAARLEREVARLTLVVEAKEAAENLAAIHGKLI